MQETNEGEENLAPQDRSEVTTGAARLGAALPNTSTEQPTPRPSWRHCEKSARVGLHVYRVGLHVYQDRPAQETADPGLTRA